MNDLSFLEKYHLGQRVETKSGWTGTIINLFFDFSYGLVSSDECKAIVLIDGEVKKEECKIKNLKILEEK